REQSFGPQTTKKDKAGGHAQQVADNSETSPLVTRAYGACEGGGPPRLCRTPVKGARPPGETGREDY
ncbi:hypothetical protein ABG768_013551, partial [Culter alburnus]